RLQAHRQRWLVPAAARRGRAPLPLRVLRSRARRGPLPAVSATLSTASVTRAPWHARPRGAWPLAAVLALAAGLRLATLDLQSFWYDEAFTPVHVLHASLGATLRGVVHTENSPPLWYLIE